MTPITTRAVLLAAGRGARFGGEVPKQFAPLGGIPVFEHSLRALHRFVGMREIVVVVPRVPKKGNAQIQKLIRDLKTLLDAYYPKTKVIEGGERRQDSVAAGLSAFSGACDVALVHDAARPFPPTKSIRALIDAVARYESDSRDAKKKFGGGLLAMPVTDTVKRSRPDGAVADTLDRRELWLAQTPQAIHGSLLPRVIAQLKSQREFTDESAVLERMRVPSLLVTGSPENFKITLPGDLERAESHLHTRSL